jgi:mannosyltransferase
MPSSKSRPEAMRQDAVELDRSGERLWTPLSVVIVAISLVVGAILRFLFLVRKTFWFDECFSVEVARLHWHDFAMLLWRREANMSLFYLLLRGWLHFGSSPYFIRSLSVVFSLSALPALFWLAGKLFNRRVAMLSVALLSVNAYHIRYAQEVRSYSLFVLLAILSSGFFVELLRKPSDRNCCGYIISSTLAVYSHLFAVLLVTAQWLSLRYWLSGRKIAGTGTVASGRFLRKAWIWIGVACAPLLIFAAKTGAGPIRWIQRPRFHDLLRVAEQMAGNDGAPLLLLYLAACAFAVFGRETFREPAGESDKWQHWRIRFLLLWWLFPPALILVLSLGRPLFLGRYFIFCMPALIVLAAAGLTKLHSRWLSLVALAAVLVLSVRGTASYYRRDFDLERDGSEAATNHILDDAHAGDVILFHIAEARVPYEFFKAIREKDSNRLSNAPEVAYPRHGEGLDYRDFTGKPSRELVKSIGDHYTRVWLVLMSNGSPGHPDATTMMLNQVLAAFPHEQRIEFPQVEVRLYSTLN